MSNKISDSDLKLLARKDACLSELERLASVAARELLARRAADTQPVKLPMFYKIDGFDGLVPAKDNSEGFLFYSDDVLAMLKAAGVKVEGE